MFVNDISEHCVASAFCPLILDDHVFSLPLAVLHDFSKSEVSHLHSAICMLSQCMTSTVKEMQECERVSGTARILTQRSAVSFISPANDTASRTTSATHSHAAAPASSPRVDVPVDGYNACTC